MRDRWNYSCLGLDCVNIIIISSEFGGKAVKVVQLTFG